MIAAASIQEAAHDLHGEAIRIRRHIHRNPELSFEERETAAFISSELGRAGIPHRTGIAGHGIVATVTGRRGADGPVVALRADMDALPVTEAAEHEYASCRTGVMHACGHDGHSASLLTAGRILTRFADEVRGTVRLVFQPAEERAPGGARAMVEAGVLEQPRVLEVYGQHVNTELPAGTVGFAAGLFMASADEIYLTVRGRGGHAAKPHQANDPVIIASTLIVTLQQIVSRAADPIVPSVLTFGRVIANGAANVIPDSVEIAGTFRTVDEAWREEALRRIERTAKEITAALGGEAELRIVRGYPAVVNDPEVTAFARERAVEYLGAERVVALPPAMWAEDFAYYAQQRPACFYNLGVRNEERGIVHAVHTPRFNLDEDALAVGAGLLAWIAVGALEARAAFAI